jgi:hypothetical protein
MPWPFTRPGKGQDPYSSRSCEGSDSSQTHLLSDNHLADEEPFPDLPFPGYQQLPSSPESLSDDDDDNDAHSGIQRPETPASRMASDAQAGGADGYHNGDAGAPAPEVADISLSPVAAVPHLSAHEEAQNRAVEEVLKSDVSFSRAPGEGGMVD